MRICEFIHDHDHPETPSNIDLWVQNNKEMTTEKIWVNGAERLPDPDQYDLLILHGGSQHLWNKDADPWLQGEIQYVREMLEAGKPVVGFCLGGQIIAEALGQRVYPAKVKEKGFYDILPVQGSKGHILMNGLEEGFISFEWHSDHYDLPEGCVSLAYTPAAENQYFYSTRVPAVGFQFHPEYTKDIILSSVRDFDQEYWSISGRVYGRKYFIERLEELQETYGLFSQLMKNTLKWLKSI